MRRARTSLSTRITRLEQTLEELGGLEEQRKARQETRQWREWMNTIGRRPEYHDLLSLDLDFGLACTDAFVDLVFNNDEPRATQAIEKAKDILLQLKERANEHGLLDLLPYGEDSVFTLPRLRALADPGSAT